jgi:tetratricopeptide (TPR) repeat protein
MYGYLQQGRFEKAKELLDQQIEYTNELSSPDARAHLLMMKGHYLLHTNDWKSKYASLAIKTDDMGATDRYIDRYFEGYKLFCQKRTDELAKHIDTFEKDLERDKQLQKASEDVIVCSVKAYANVAPTAQQITMGTKRMNQLKGMLAWLRKDDAAAENFLKESLPRDGLVVIGPPFMILSPNELYGDFLLEHNRPAEALQQFDKALGMSPNRYIGLKGKLAAAKALKDTETEAKTLTQLKQNLKNADARAHQGLW